MKTQRRGNLCEAHPAFVSSFYVARTVLVKTFSGIVQRPFTQGYSTQQVVKCRQAILNAKTVAWLCRKCHWGSTKIFFFRAMPRAYLCNDVDGKHLTKVVYVSFNTQYSTLQRNCFRVWKMGMWRHRYFDQLKHQTKSEREKKPTSSYSTYRPLMVQRLLQPLQRATLQREFGPGSTSLAFGRCQGTLVWAPRNIISPCVQTVCVRACVCMCASILDWGCSLLYI